VILAVDRRLRILADLFPEPDAELNTERLGQVCKEATSVTGAGVMLLSEDVTGESVCTTDAVSARIAELHDLLGEGPGVDAYLSNRPVLEPDLADPSTRRWIAFRAAAVEAGACAIFSFPLHVGSVRVGALALYCDQPGPLSDEQHAYALVMADVAAEGVLIMQAEAPPGAVGAELRAGAEFRYVVHQASGMVSAHLDVPIAQALVRLRAYAFGHDRRLTEVAEDVVGRRLRFYDRDGGEDRTI
jgi:hypothetical protein